MLASPSSSTNDVPLILPEIAPPVSRDLPRAPIVFFTLSALFCDYMTLTSIIPILPVILTDTDPTLLFLLFASKSLVQVFANPLVGRLVDSEKIALTSAFSTSLFVLIVSTLGFAYGVTERDFTILLSSRAVQGLASAGIITSGMATITLTTPANKHGEKLGTAQVGIALGVLLGPPVAGLMSEDISNESVFFLIAGIGGITLISYMLFLRFSPDSFVPLGDDEEVGGSNDGYSVNDNNDISAFDAFDDNKSLYLHPPTSVLGIAVTACNMCVSLTEPLLPLFLKADPFNYNSRQIGFCFAVQALSYTVFTPVFGILADKNRKTPLMTFGIFITAAGSCVVFLTDRLSVTLAGLALTGMGVSAVDTPSMPLLTMLVPTRMTARAMALQDTAVNVGFLLGPVVAIIGDGVVSNFKWLGIGVGGLCVLVVPLMPAIVGKGEMDVIGKGGVGLDDKC